MENTSIAQGWGENSPFQLQAEEYRYMHRRGSVGNVFQAENAGNPLFGAWNFKNLRGEGGGIPRTP